MDDPLCKCGHLRSLHRDREAHDGRNPCRGSVRQFFGRVPDHYRQHLRPSDVELTDDQWKSILEELYNKAQKHSNYEKRFFKTLQQGYRTIDCQCPMYHTVDLGQVKLFTPGGADES